MEKVLYIGEREGETVNLSLIVENIRRFPSYKFFHGQPTFQNFWLFFCVEIARASNRTILPLLSSTIVNQSLDAVVHPMLYLSPGSTITNLWDTVYSQSLQCEICLPVFIHIDHLYQSFIYCGKLQLQNDSAMNSVYFLLSSFGNQIFCLLAAAAFGIVVILFYTDKLFREPISYVNWSSVSLFVWSGILSPVLGHVSQVRKTVSNRFLVFCWLITNTILVTYYVGTLTMKLTYSPPANRVETVKELLSTNATVLYTTEYWRNGDLEVSKLLNFTLMVKLLERAVIEENFVTFLSKYDKMSYFAFRMELVRVIGWINEKRKGSRRCYIGKEWFFPYHAYLVFTGGGSSPVVDIVRKFVSSGVLERWYTEQNTFLAFDRIQDTARESSTAKHRDSIGSQLKAVTMNGQMWGVVVLYAVLCAISILVFMWERYRVR